MELKFTAKSSKPTKSLSSINSILKLVSHRKMYTSLIKYTNNNCAMINVFSNYEIPFNYTLNVKCNFNDDKKEWFKKSKHNKTIIIKKIEENHYELFVKPDELIQSLDKFM